MRFSYPVVLASSSPRRRELMETMGIDFTVDVSAAEEPVFHTPQETVKNLSRVKAEAVASRHTAALIVGADTVVSADGQILGKPKDKAQALAMLRLLSGAWHEVFSGVCVINTRTGVCLQEVVCTRVHFVPMTEAQMEEYVKTGEPYDKAGGYAIQGMGGMYIDAIEGSFSNVIGLPMTTLAELLRRADA